MTVDPKQRLTIQNLRDNAWIQGCNPEVFSTTPLQMNELAMWKRSAAKVQVSTTLNAFQKAHREGFRLQDVATAPLAQRRKMKRSSQDTCHSSSSSLSELSRNSASPSPSKRVSPLTIPTSSVNQIFFPQLASTKERSLSNATNDSGTCADIGTKNDSLSSGSVRDFRVAALKPTVTPVSRDISECHEITASVVDLNVSPENVRGVKRRLDLEQTFETDSDDDDCIIIEEKSSQKRLRASTIVID